MNLISCDNCGIVLDLNKIEFLPSEEEDECSINTENTIWEDGEYWKCIECPNCKELIKTSEKA